jgi:hypothetical protein
VDDKEKEGVLGGIFRCLEWVAFARIVGAPSKSALAMATSYLDYYFGRIHGAHELSVIRGELRAHRLNALLADQDYENPT